MIREIACDIETIVMSSGYVNTHWQWAEWIKNGEVSYYSQYDVGGNYDQIFNNDVGGNSYLRKSGAVGFGNVTGTDNLKFMACGDNPFVKLTLPLRLVMVVPKSKLSDDAFSDDLLALEMIKAISSDVVVQIEGVRSLEYNIVSYDTDSILIWNNETKGIEYQMNFDYSYIAINFNAVAIVNPSCLNLNCNAY